MIGLTIMTALSCVGYAKLKINTQTNNNTIFEWFYYSKKQLNISRTMCVNHKSKLLCQSQIEAQQLIKLTLKTQIHVNDLKLIDKNVFVQNVKIHHWDCYKWLLCMSISFLIVRDCIIFGLDICMLVCVFMINCFQVLSLFITECWFHIQEHNNGIKSIL